MKRTRKDGYWTGRKHSEASLAKMRGENRPNAVLNPPRVREIRRRVKKETHQAVADDMRIARSTVSMVVNRHRWDHVR